MIQSWRPSQHQVLTLLLTLVGMAVVSLLSHPALPWQGQVVVIAVFVLALVFLMASRAGLELHLYLLLLTLVIGWRTERIAGVVVDSQQALAWLLCLHILLVVVAKPAALNLRGGRLILLTLLVVGCGSLVAAFQGRPLSHILTEAGPLILCAPVVFAMRTLITDQVAYRRVEVVLALAVLGMVVPGLVEYGLHFGDPVRTHLRYISTFATFIGANFTFWGTSTIGYALTPLVLLLIPAAFNQDDALPIRWLVRVALGLGIVAVVVTGQRGAWIALAVGLVVLAFLMRRGQMLVVAALFAGWFLLPESIRISLFALLDPSFESGYYDSSALGRYARIESTLRTIQASPWWGVGLGGSGWVHSDILQLAANLGVPLAFLLVGSWFYPFYRLLQRDRWQLVQIWRRYLPVDLSEAALFAAAVASLVLLASQALIVISALVMPVWIVIGLGWVRYEMEM